MRLSSQPSPSPAPDGAPEQRLADALAHLAAHDALTGLPNRAAFIERLAAAVDAGRPVAVVTLDLDRFRLVNDGFGHNAGDDLLIGVASRLREASRHDDLIARMGGDEFAVLCEGVRDASEALAIARRLRDALAAPFELGGEPRAVSLGIGCRVAGSADDGIDADALLRDAVVAMDEAKRRGPNRVQLFAESVRSRVLRRLELEAGLRAAIEQRTLAVHYQPQVDLATSAVRGVEALARFTHPVLGAIAPPEFIAVAEETGLIAPLGLHVLRVACEQLAAWRADGLRLTVTVNVSVHQLDDPDFAGRVLATIAAAGLAPSDVCLELTESAVMGAGAGPLQVLETLAGAGVYIAVDDFGTGYSSLATLKRLPVEVLKVDRSFVDGLGTDPDDTAIVASIMSLAHAMGLHVIAEGVETVQQAEELAGLGCAVAQGWLYAPALPAADVPGAVANCRRRVGGRSEPRGFGGERSLIDEMMRQAGFEREAS